MWLLIFIIPFLIWVDIRLFNIYYKFIFNDENDFDNSVKYTLTPDIFSLFKGEYFKDKVAEAKLGALIFLSFVTIAIEILIVRCVLDIL